MTPSSPQDPTEFNRLAWDNIASSTKWFAPVDKATIDAAKRGDWSIRVTATKAIPADWLGDVRGVDILCLAGGGGHQGPVLAAAGANVTIADFSSQQLRLDQQVARENDLPLNIVCCDMSDLNCFDRESFDLIVNPCSVNFCAEVLPIWREAYRVLRVGGNLIAGLINPINYLFDATALDKGKFVVRHKIPYNDLDLTSDERDATLGAERPIDFGHTLSSLLKGQMTAGFRIIGLFEDAWGGHDPLSKRIATFLCTRAIKSKH